MKLAKKFNLALDTALKGLFFVPIFKERRMYEEL